MKLNKQKWIQEVRRVEAEIRVLKDAMHKPDYQLTFSHSMLHKLKAEATRLYALRRVMKKKSMQLKSFFYTAVNGKYSWTYWKRTEDMDEAQVLTFIIESIPGWKDGFLIEDPVDAIAPEYVPQEAVVS